jgi:hypothetical protein
MSEEEGWSEVRQQHDLDDRYEGDNKDDNYELRTVRCRMIFLVMVSHGIMDNSPGSDRIGLSSSYHLPIETS